MSGERRPMRGADLGKIEKGKFADDNAAHVQ